MKRPESGNHALVVGVVLGALMRAGLDVEVIDDAGGWHLDTLRVTHASGTYLVSVRPEQGS